MKVGIRVDSKLGKFLIFYDSSLDHSTKYKKNKNQSIKYVHEDVNSFKELYGRDFK